MRELLSYKQVKWCSTYLELHNWSIRLFLPLTPTLTLILFPPVTLTLTLIPCLRPFQCLPNYLILLSSSWVSFYLHIYLCLCPFLCSPSYSFIFFFTIFLTNYSIYPLSPRSSLPLILIHIHINYSVCIAAANVGSATDASALLGVVTKGLQRLRAEVILQQSVIFVIRILHYSFYCIYIFFILYFLFFIFYLYLNSDFVLN